MTITKTAFPLAICVAGWIYLALGAGMNMDLDMRMNAGPMNAGPMNAGPMNAGPMPGAGGMMPMPSGLTWFGALIVMWWGMMMAMMIPGAMAHMGPSHAPRFWLGYGAVWLGFSLAVTGVQMVLDGAELIGAMSMASQSELLSAVLLGIAGLYQFLPMKHRLLARCQKGGLSGLGYGAVCVGITAPLMLLLFVGGVMNMLWIIGLAAVTAIEKTLYPAIWVSRTIGAACFMGAVAVFF